MESVIRPVLVYLVLLLLLRLTGKRTLAQITSFDFVLLLTIGNATQQALIGEDNSMVHGAILVATLISLNYVLQLLKQHSKWFSHVLDDIPLVIVADGKPLKDRMHKARVDEDDVMDAARESCGLEHMDQIRHAILERDGQISIIPRSRA
ncbi:MAG TPA: YetF domain-containing protein [Steroidobacteraceae bacterium]|nr:YetF domain-containing protein [Steroidobacteraceae bacterium]